jgi:hypothetical protein
MATILDACADFLRGVSAIDNAYNGGDLGTTVDEVAASMFPDEFISATEINRDRVNDITSPGQFGISANINSDDAVEVVRAYFLMAVDTLIQIRMGRESSRGVDRTVLINRFRAINSSRVIITDWRFYVLESKTKGLNYKQDMENTYELAKKAVSLLREKLCV